MSVNSKLQQPTPHGHLNLWRSVCSNSRPRAKSAFKCPTLAQFLLNYYLCDKRTFLNIGKFLVQLSGFSLLGVIPRCEICSRKRTPYVFHWFTFTTPPRQGPNSQPPGARTTVQCPCVGDVEASNWYVIITYHWRVLLARQCCIKCYLSVTSSPSRPVF